uniref:Uncharacterized protein n=1 Tax=Lepeophtheirus salmonis TaxID=72036 RepID=A0A0K2T569_LEPSM
MSPHGHYLRKIQLADVPHMLYTMFGTPLAHTL